MWDLLLFDVCDQHKKLKKFKQHLKLRHLRNRNSDFFFQKTIKYASKMVYLHFSMLRTGSNTLPSRRVSARSKKIYLKTVDNKNETNVSCK